MKDKKYQVFISSTYTDLIEERKKILEVLLMADCIPAGMEAFVATDNEQFEVIKKVIDLCDYYVLIIGQRYGSINEATGISYTEMEYEYAKQQGVPVLVFAIDSSVELPEEKRETDSNKIEKLKRFRANALNNRLASMWKDGGDLAGKVAIAIMQAKTEIARPGWQRAVDYDEASLRKQIMELTETNQDITEKLKNAEATITELTSHTDLAFEDCEYNIDYHFYVRVGTFSSGKPKQEKRTATVSLKLTTIFERISTEMLAVSILERRIETVIHHLVDPSQTVYFNDEQIIKRILNQLKELNLLNSKWSDNAKQLYWGLTTKGEKVRNDMILVKNK